MLLSSCLYKLGFQLEVWHISASAFKFFIILRRNMKISRDLSIVITLVCYSVILCRIFYVLKRFVFPVFFPHSNFNRIKMKF